MPHALTVSSPGNPSKLLEAAAFPRLLRGAEERMGLGRGLSMGNRSSAIEAAVRVVLAVLLFGCGETPAAENAGRGGEAPWSGGGGAAGSATTSEGGGGAAPATPTWCTTQWPLATSAAAGFPTETLFVRVLVDGVTPSGGADPALVVEVGAGPADQPPSGDAWTWSAAVPNPECLECGDHDEHMGSAIPSSTAATAWAGRVAYGPDPWTYCDRADGGRQGSADGFHGPDAPQLTVAEPGELSVVTVNLRCLLDDWDARKPLIVDALVAAHADAVAVQEACAEQGGGGRDNVVELVAALETETGLVWSVHRAVTHTSWDLYDEGVAVLAPHPFAGTAVVDLPPGVFPRKLVAARVVGAQGPVVVGATHLDYESAAVRAAQADAAVSGASQLASPGEAIVVGGDMNETPGGAAGDVLAAAGFVDLWADLEPQAPGYTFPADVPQARIDYLWLRAASSGFAPASVTVILGQPVGGVTGSDHRAVHGIVARP